MRNTNSGKIIRLCLIFFIPLFAWGHVTGIVHAADQVATVKINKDVVFQKITGFGGFVCNPQFQYGHMSEAEIRKLWGKDSDAGYNIMRLYIPAGTGADATSWRTTWSACLSTAKLARELGLIIFASPWSMPAVWKQYNTVNATSDGNDNYLKEEYYDEYAAYLKEFVTYLKENDVDLYAISIQNEPDMDASYAGCIWTPAQIAKFVKEQGGNIIPVGSNCKVIAAEGVGITDNYANALLPDDVITNLDIFAGHQYNGNIGSVHKQIQAKGKEVWMTEWLNQGGWANHTDEVFDWPTHTFQFTDRIHSALTNNINAWVHYAAKRFYGMLGDGLRGTVNGEITKYGYILSQYAKYVTGATRIENTWKDDSGILKGTSYLSATGDSVIVVVANSSNDSYTLTVDLPFYTVEGEQITTSAMLDWEQKDISPVEETCRPKVDIAASAFTTLLFIKNNERPASQMTSEAIHHNKIENQSITNVAFGNDYQLSGKTGVVFNHSQTRYLISGNNTDDNGYLSLNESYDKLVFRLNSVSGGTASGNTTIYYINSQGALNSHNYGDLQLTGGTDWVLDISRNVLTDGCKGIIGIRNSNYGTVLNINFGDVYFLLNNEKMHKFTGVYNAGDGDLFDCLEDPTYVSLDFSAVTGLSGSENWHAAAANKNSLFYVDGGTSNTNPNVVSGTTCQQLVLTDDGGYFYAPDDFTATSASYTCILDGYKTLVLPFEADIPQGLTVYNIAYSSGKMVCTNISGNKISANTPVLIAGTGTFTLTGAGAVSASQQETNGLNGVYVTTKAPVGSYYLKTDNTGVSVFNKVTEGENVAITPFNAYLIQDSESAVSLSIEISSNDAQTPIVGDPQSAAYNVGDAVTDLSVTASVLDGGTLSYQWYSNSINSNTGGTLISGETAANYTPSTAAAGITYYYVEVTNTNNSVSGTKVVMKASAPAMITVNVNTFDISIGVFTGGSVTANKISNITSGETITLTIVPVSNYVLDAISAYKSGEETTPVNLSGAENTRTFSMPAYGVTVVATFRNLSQEAVDAAKALIEGVSNWTVNQSVANTESDIKTWLATYINDLNGMSATGVTVQASNISTSTFTAANAGTDGSFSFTVSLSNDGGSAVTASLSGTITAVPYYAITVGGPYANGNISSDKASATQGEVITLTVAPVTGYELDLLSVYRTGDAGAPVTTQNSVPLQYTFTMPAFGVTVVGTFRKTQALLDEEAVEAAKILIESGYWTADQSIANTESGIKTWLAYQINHTLPGMNATGITVTANDITLSNFDSAMEGTASDPSGIDGSFDFVVSLTRGAFNLTASNSGTITATEYVEPLYLITIVTTSNGSVGPESVVTAGTVVTLTISPAAGYEPDEIRAYRLDNGAQVEIRLIAPLQCEITMPPCDVTVRVTFKKTQAQLDKETVEAAKIAIEGGSYRIAQATANDADGVKSWLAGTLNVLFGQSNGIQFRSTQQSIQTSIVGDVTITAITPAVAGTESNPSGTDGLFGFVITLTKGATTLTTSIVSGEIIATPYAGMSVKRIELLTLGNLIVRIINTGNVATGDISLALSGADASVFALPSTTVGRLAAGEETDIMLTRSAALHQGVYTAILTVSAEGMDPVTVEIRYTVTPSGMDNISQPTGLNAWTRDGRLHVSGLYAGRQWSVYSLSGTLVYQTVAVGDKADVALTMHGVYIVTSGNQTVKVISR
jgi:glucuronoarabinoxylan endo-1,4-beta-xylanase